MKTQASWLYEFITYVVVVEQIIRMLCSIMNQLILLKASTATSYPTWPGQSCKLPAFSRMFLLKVVITAQPRILLITSPIHIGLTPAFLSKRKSLQAMKVPSHPSFPQYLFKQFLCHNFFAMHFLLVFPDVSINMFMFHFVDSSCIEDTTCCR